MAACEVLPWPECRRPSNTITHPTPSEAAKPSKPSPFRVQDLNSVRSILVNNNTSSLFYARGSEVWKRPSNLVVLVNEGPLLCWPGREAGPCKASGRLRGFWQAFQGGRPFQGLLKQTLPIMAAPTRRLPGPGP